MTQFTNALKNTLSEEIQIHLKPLPITYEVDVRNNTQFNISF